MRGSFRSQIGYVFFQIVGGTVDFLNMVLRVLVGFYYFGWITFLLFGLSKLEAFIEKKREISEAKRRKERKQQENNKSVINPTSILRQYEFFKMKALENRLFAFMVRWDITKKWWMIQSTSKQVLVGLFYKLCSTVAKCSFIALVIFTIKDLNPAAVLIMESCLQSAERLFYS